MKLAALHVAHIPYYKQLMRTDKPIGTLLLLWPTYWALWLANQGAPSLLNFVVFLPINEKQCNPMIAYWSIIPNGLICILEMVSSFRVNSHLAILALFPSLRVSRGGDLIDR